MTLLAEKLDAMAERLIDASNGGEMDIKDQVDIFKASSAWALGRMKQAKGVEEKPDGETFDKVAQRLNGKGITAQ